MAETRFTPDVDLDGLAPDEAFAVLGNEIRLDIVRVLWHADAVHEYDDLTDAAGTMSFSGLRREVDVDDNGKFNYHLSELSPHFVRRTDDGYRLSAAGKQIARTVIAISGPESVDFSTELDHPCPLCGASLAATYEDQWLRIRCTECDGLYGDETPQGAIFFSNVPAGGLGNRPPEEALSTELYRCMLDIAATMRGYCRECTGRISTAVSVCDDHRVAADDPCSDCGTRFPVWVEQRCVVCGFAKRLPVEVFTLGLTPVIGFLDELGIDVLAPSFADVVDLLRRRVDTAVADDPFRVSVTIEGDSARLGVALDEEMNVVDVDRPHSDRSATS